MRPPIASTWMRKNQYFRLMVLNSIDDLIGELSNTHVIACGTSNNNWKRKRCLLCGTQRKFFQNLLIVYILYQQIDEVLYLEHSSMRLEGIIFQNTL